MDEELKGKRVELIRMDDQWSKLEPGDQGTIWRVDDIGNIMVKWDNGSTLSLVPEADDFIILESRIKRFREF